jgi:hypothetical protein
MRRRNEKDWRRCGSGNKYIRGAGGAGADWCGNKNIRGCFNPLVTNKMKKNVQPSFEGILGSVGLWIHGAL